MNSLSCLILTLCMLTIVTTMHTQHRPCFSNPIILAASLQHSSRVLALCSNFDVTLYADDSVLTLSHKDVVSLQNEINQELHKIEKWLCINKFE